MNEEECWNYFNWRTLKHSKNPDNGTFSNLSGLNIDYNSWFVPGVILLVYKVIFLSDKLFRPATHTQTHSLKICIEVWRDIGCHQNYIHDLCGISLHVNLCPCNHHIIICSFIFSPLTFVLCGVLMMRTMSNYLFLAEKDNSEVVLSNYLGIRRILQQIDQFWGAATKCCITV